MTALDRTMHRALVEAGLAPLDEYLARFASDRENPAMPAPDSFDPFDYPEALQPQDEPRRWSPRQKRAAVLAAAGALWLLVILAAIGAAALFGVRV